jgi:3-phosphoshikimate 1-carboxyvinyltransferase
VSPTGEILVDPRHLRPAALEPPLSKSDAQRALVLAHARGRPEFAAIEPWRAAGLPDDVVRLEAGLERLRHPEPELEIDCGEGGAPFRFLLTQAALAPGKRVRLLGSKRLGERPRAALFESLDEALGPSGFRWRALGEPWPIEVLGVAPASPPSFRVRAGESSQFASSLLLGAATLAARGGGEVQVQLEGEPASAGYLELTLEWLRRFGFDVRRSGADLRVAPGSPPASPPQIPGDWSSVAYLLLIAWRSGGEVLHADLSAPHPDRAIVRVLEELGLRVDRASSGALRVLGTPCSGLAADGAECPDLLPTLAALACVLPGPSELRGVEILRHKESDRLEGIRALAGAFGASTSLGDGRLTLSPPPRAPGAFALDPRGDHRMAMSAATLAVLSGAALRLASPDCVKKSFPRFWEQLDRAGVAGGV